LAGPPQCDQRTQCLDGNGVCQNNIEAVLTAPDITCLSFTGSQITLQICGTGTYGALAGFTVQMKTKAEFDADYAANPGAPCENRGWNTATPPGWTDPPSYTAWSLSGQCQGGNSVWSLDAGECVNLIIDADFVTRYATTCGVSGPGVVLTCGTEYVFRVFAHNYSDNQSCPKLSLKTSPQGPSGGTPCSTGLVCHTADCPGPDGHCTFTWGYWKTHGPDAAGCSPGNQANDWDVTSLSIGGESLDAAALCAILHDNPNSCGKGGGANAVLILEHQLIAAMLNVADTAIVCPSATQAIIDANNILSGHVHDCVGTSSVLGQQMLGIQEILAAYNSDICECSVPPGKPQAVPGTATDVKRSSWGKVKTIYR